MFKWLVGLAISCIASASCAQTFYHDGSLVQVTADGQQVTIRYLKPKPGLPRSVQPGTILFEGGVSERSKAIEGYAYTFSQKCGRDSFWAFSEQSDWSAGFELEGNAQIKHQRTCQPVFIDHARLKFTPAP